MRLGFGLLTLFPNRVGGTETYVHNLLAQFARGNGPEQVIVLANRHVEESYRNRVSGPVSLSRVRSYRSGDSDVTRALAMAAARAWPARAARDVPPDLDVLHLPVTVPVPQLGIPTIVTIHEVQYHVLPQLFSRLDRVYRRWAYDGSALAADVVIAVSKYVADKLAELLNIPPDRIEVVHHGIDHEVFRPERAPGEDELLSSFGLPERFVFYPANIWAHKNHERLLEALAASADDELALLLSGQTYGRLEALLAHARRLGVEQRVRHIGHVSPSTVAAVLRRAQALVYPSLHEGFGAPPLEAMACGCPVASSLNTSLVEVCGDSVEHLQPDDPAQMAAAIDRVTGDRATRRRLREAGLARAARFTWEGAALRHRAIYEELAATSDGRRGSHV
jgi:glycosyltransferase involved in cell wall biosynthesis